MSGADIDIVAQQVNDLNEKVATLSDNVVTLTVRLDEVEGVNARLESAAQITARSLQEISRHWDLVYEAMRRGMRR